MPTQSAGVQYTPEQVEAQYEDCLNEAAVMGMISSLYAVFYHRIFTPFVVVWGFMFQRLNQTHTCDAFVSYVSTHAAHWCPGGEPPSQSNSAYCQGRARLPREVPARVLRHTARHLTQRFDQDGLWQGRETYLLDGSTLRLMATEELRLYYGLPGNQHGQSHWPVMRVVVAFHAWHGGVAAAAQGPYEATEISLSHTVLAQLPSGAVVVGDALFGIFQVMQGLRHHQLDGVVRLQVGHIARWTRGRSFRHGRDEAVTWTPSPSDQLQPGMSAQPIQGRLLWLHSQRDGFRPQEMYLFTTLTDRQRYPLAAIAQLYDRRWRVELDLRHVKTTLGMDALDGKSVNIVQKEVYLGLAAYNLLRMLMTTAALRAHTDPLQLSLSACVTRLMDAARTLPGWPMLFLDPRYATQVEQLLDHMAGCRLPQRKRARAEPRAVWRKPCPYPPIRGSRQQARQEAFAKQQLS